MNSDKEISDIIRKHAKHLKSWMKLLCNTQERLEMFMAMFYGSSRLVVSLCEFQLHLKRIGRGQDINYNQLKECINKRNTVELRALLEEMLLVPVSMDAIKALKKRSLINFFDEFKATSGKAIVSFTGNAIHTMVV